LDLARTGRYELVVLISSCPGWTGSPCWRLIDERPQQRVLVLSALSDVKEKVRCLS
jgi:DNA-binding response OmpR family regulator